MQKLLGSLVWLLVASSIQASELTFTTQDFQPFNYKMDGVVAGPAADLIRKVCGELNIQCPMTLLPWARAQNEVRQGKVNGMFVIGWNAKREKWLHFSPPLLTTEYGFFVRDDNDLKFERVEDVKGYKVAVYGPSNTSRSLEKIKEQIQDMEIDIRPKDESGFHKLSRGRVDAVFSNRDVGHHLIQKLSLKNIRYAGQQRTLEYYIGFSQKYTDKELVKKFNKTIIKLYEEGEVQKILSNYHMTSADPSKSTKWLR